MADSITIDVLAEHKVPEETTVEEVTEMTSLTRNQVSSNFLITKKLITKIMANRKQDIHIE